MSSTIIASKPRREFMLGGLSFSAPAVIGAGHRARYTEEQMHLAMSSPEASQLLELSKDYESKEIYKAALVAHNSAHPYKAVLSILNTVLTPNGDYTVADGYEQATDQEVKAVTDFFSATLHDKTESESSNKRAGKNSVVKRSGSR